MAVRGKKCLDIKQAKWISSSFCDSFGVTQDEGVEGDGEDVHIPAEKRTKHENCDKSDFINKSVKICEDVLLFENGSDKCNDSGLKLQCGRIWTDKYAPKRLDDLVVHKKKVSDVCDYLKSVFSCNINNRILLITGPTGCGKTCTLDILCRHLEVSIVEWVTPLDNCSSVHTSDYDSFRSLSESNRFLGSSKNVTLQFDEFILQAAKYSSLLSTNHCRKIVLVKDFPNIFLEHPEFFHETIRKHYGIGNNRHIYPAIFIASDTNIARELFPDDLKLEMNIANIVFNPITSTNIVKCLEKIVSVEFSRLKNTSLKKPSKDDLLNIAESSDGDLRSAILKLQFSLSDCSDSSGFNFKVPKSVSNPNSERIRMIKSTSKSKSDNLKICEIDKDKTVDFFNSIGRVLYPKKKFLDDSKQNYRFVYSPNSIVDVYLTEPNKFINILQENYLDRFTNIKDVCNAANDLSISDLLSSFWEAKDTMVEYSLNTATRSLMVSNSNPAPNKFRPITKSRIWSAANKVKINRDLVRQVFPDLQSEKDLLLDVIPYLNRLKVNINLTADQNQIISKIAQFS